MRLDSTTYRSCYYDAACNFQMSPDGSLVVRAGKVTNDFPVIGVSRTRLILNRASTLAGTQLSNRRTAEVRPSITCSLVQIIVDRDRKVCFHAPDSRYIIRGIIFIRLHNQYYLNHAINIFTLTISDCKKMVHSRNFAIMIKTAFLDILEIT